MHSDMLAAINRYQELFAQADIDNSPEDVADLVRGGQYLIQLMAREIVMLGRKTEVRHAAH